MEYLRTLRLKFQKAQTKVEVVLSLPCWLSQFSWDSQQGRLRTTSILVRAFWNFKRKFLKYSRNCSLHSTLIPNLVKPLMYVVRCTLYILVYQGMGISKLPKRLPVFLVKCKITKNWLSIIIASGDLLLGWESPAPLGPLCWRVSAKIMEFRFHWIFYIDAK